MGGGVGNVDCVICLVDCVSVGSGCYLSSCWPTADAPQSFTAHYLSRLLIKKISHTVATSKGQTHAYGFCWGEQRQKDKGAIFCSAP